MRRSSVMVMTLLVGGCALVQPVSRGATLILKPQVLAGAHIQTILNPYDRTSINHLKLEVFPLASGVPQAKVAGQTLLNAQLDNPVVFSNLKANTQYRIQASAYYSADDTQLISIPASSSLDLSLLADDRPTLSTLQVSLMDRPFNGQASSSLNINNGVYVPVASETAALGYIPLTGSVQTIAGVYNISGMVDGPGMAARFGILQCITSDNDGNLFLADQGNPVIRKVAPDGMVSTFVGNAGTAGNVDGTGSAARLTAPVGIVYNRKTGDFYFTALNGHYIRKISSAGVVTAFVGSEASGFSNGTGTSALFNQAFPIAIDSQGNLFVPDRVNHAIRKVTPAGVVTTFAGNGTAGHQDGQGVSAQFEYPFGCAVDPSDNVYVSDNSQKILRKITPGGLVSTLAGAYGTAGGADGTGTAATFGYIHGLTCDALGNIFITDYNNKKIRKVTPSGVVTTVAGNGTASFIDGIGSQAGFVEPRMCYIAPDGTLYITDKYSLRRMR